MATSTSLIREAILWNRAASAKDYPDDGYRHRVDRLYSDYMSLESAWRKEVHAYLDGLKVQGERVVYADICGRTTGVKWGADVSYCFSLHTSNIMRQSHPPQDVIVDGDLFRMRDFNSFLALMRDNGDQPAFVTFYPMAGLQSYTPLSSYEHRKTKLHPEVTWQRLENNLRRLLKVVRPGGYIYLDRPFQLGSTDTLDWMQRRVLKEYQSVKWMQAFCRGKGCTVRFDRDITGVKFLVRKRASRKTTNRP
jgi:hypothetical protein